MAANKPKRNDISVRLDVKVYRKVRVAASWKGQNIAEYLSEVAGAAAERDLRRMSSEIARDRGGDAD